MRIATWNINSIRLRLGLIERYLEEEAPDILCIQETKTPNEFFPTDALAAKGYSHQYYCGMKSYNGVAIVSKMPLSETGQKNWQGRDDCRHIFARLSNGIEVHCYYVPAGGDVPDTKLNPKFAHKLGFIDEQIDWWGQKEQNNKSVILVGDLNIAPLEHDVWSHKQMQDVVSHTAIEIKKFGQWMNSNLFHDAVRHFVPKEKKLYSWWSYRAQDWEFSNRGRRLDHIWVTKDLIASLKKYSIKREARNWQPKPSDHVPVLIELE